MMPQHSSGRCVTSLLLTTVQTSEANIFLLQTSGSSQRREPPRRSS